MTYNMFSGTLNPTQSINQSFEASNYIGTDNQTHNEQKYTQIKHKI